MWQCSVWFRWSSASVRNSVVKKRLCSNRWLVPYLNDAIKQIRNMLTDQQAAFEPSEPCLDLSGCVPIQYEAFDAPRSARGTFLCVRPSSVQETAPCGGRPLLCRGTALSGGRPWRGQGTPPSDSLTFCRGTSLSLADGWGTCPAGILCVPPCSGVVCQGLRAPEGWPPAFLKCVHCRKEVHVCWGCWGGTEAERGARIVGDICSTGGSRAFLGNAGSVDRCGEDMWHEVYWWVLWAGTNNDLHETNTHLLFIFCTF